MPRGSTGRSRITNVDEFAAAIIAAGFTPILKGRIFDTAVVADTDFFATDLEPTNTPTTFRMYIALDTAGIVSVMRDVDGTTLTENLNQGQQLIANSAYTFDFLVTDAETINIQTDVGAQILFCLVVEVPGMVS